MAVLDSLNHNNSLDFLHIHSDSFNNNQLYDNPYSNLTINGKFYDTESFTLIPNIKNSPIYLSINIQSLNSKYENLKDFILELNSKNLNVEIIAIQETWQVLYPELVSIPGYHPFISKQRVGMRGGGRFLH
jgi:hypothetical protein